MVVPTELQANSAVVAVLLPFLSLGYRQQAGAAARERQAPSVVPVGAVAQVIGTYPISLVARGQMDPTELLTLAALEEQGEVEVLPPAVEARGVVEDQRVGRVKPVATARLELLLGAAAVAAEEEGQEQVLMEATAAMVHREG